MAGACAWTAITAPARGQSPVAAEGDRTIEFDLPAQAAANALLAFSRQAKVEVLFSFEALRTTPANALSGRFEPAEALRRLLQGTGFAAHRNGGEKFVVTRVAPATGSIRGRVGGADGAALRGVTVTLSSTRHRVLTGESGEFEFPAVATGSYRLVATAEGHEPLQLAGLRVEPGHLLTLEPQTLRPLDAPSQLAAFVVEDKSGPRTAFGGSDALFAPRTAAGNLDLARTDNDALPYTIYNRDQIARSGVVNLNEFLQRELLDSDATTRPPEQNGRDETFAAGSTNLNLRGYGADQTIVLVNGRRLPEVLTSGSGTLPPDVNFIPLSLVQQVEVLPVSASSLYSGNAVGGVINIVLRPGVDAEATEVALTYTNAVAFYDAPQSSVSVLHSRALLGGALRVRFNASRTRATPPSESELRYHLARKTPPLPVQAAIYRATPNVRSATPMPIFSPGTSLVREMTITPLFGPGTSPVTSVAPGADGTGGAAAFAGRQGVRNLDFFNSPGGLATSLDSIDYPYGREQTRTAYFGSVVYDLTRWLQLGFDGTFTRTTLHRGLDVFAADLRLRDGSPLNPFGQDITVSLNETVPQLGENYGEAKLEFGSAVLSAMVTLPGSWRVLLDGQYGRNIAKYRGLVGADLGRWQQLVDQGRYNPLRDTQVFGPPREFYDQALIYRGGPGRFVTLGDYHALDAAIRVTNTALSLPTGRAVVNVGGDYRLNSLARYTDERRFADGTLFGSPIRYAGRTIERYSAFGEVQAPLLPKAWLPPGVRRLETDLAVRYVASRKTHESNTAPTFALKADLVGGFALRGSVTTSSRFPTPQLSRLATPSFGGGSGIAGVDLKRIYDPRRKQGYDVQENEVIDPGLRPEEAVTQTAGVIFQRGRVHRFRAALDYVDTRKVNELLQLELQTVLNLEATFPERVERAPIAAGEEHQAGKVTSITTGVTNLASRRSLNWNGSLDYAWTECFGGTFDAYSRLLFFERYNRRLLPTSGTVDELRRPDGAAASLLKYRAKFGAGWSNREFGFGMDGHYFHSRVLPVAEWPAQGRDRIRPFWQFDGFVQGELGRWVPWLPEGLRAQLRVNNVLNFNFPKYANEPTGAGVQAYGDWRGRVYSLSLTTTF